MPNPWRRLREALGEPGWLHLPWTLDRPPVRSSPRLVALATPNLPAPDPLKEAARLLVRALDDYRAGFERRFDRDRRYRLGREGFWSRFGVPLGRAREAYCLAARTSPDPFHQDLTRLLESSDAWLWPLRLDGSVLRTLENWVRDEPRSEALPAPSSWFEEVLPRVELVTARPERCYTTTLTLEAKQRLPRPLILSIDVGTDLSFATVSLIACRDGSSRTTDVIWKGSRIWVILEAPRLDEGDGLRITVSSAKPITRSTARISYLPAGRSNDATRLAARA